MQAITGGSLPEDCYLLLDEGLSLEQRLRSVAWQPQHLVTGLPEPAPTHRQPPPIDTPATAPNEDNRARLDELRSKSAYPRLRRMLVILLVWALLVTALGLLVLLSTDSLTVGGTLLVLVATLLEVLGILVGYGLVLTIVDIADSSVRRYPRS